MYTQVILDNLDSLRCVYIFMPHLEFKNHHLQHPRKPSNPAQQFTATATYLTSCSQWSVVILFGHKSGIFFENVGITRSAIAHESSERIRKMHGPKLYLYLQPGALLKVGFEFPLERDAHLLLQDISTRSEISRVCLWETETAVLDEALLLLLVGG